MWKTLLKLQPLSAIKVERTTKSPRYKVLKYAFYSMAVPSGLYYLWPEYSSSICLK